MRRAYDYMEYPSSDTDILSNPYFTAELEIAKNIVCGSPVICHDGKQPTRSQTDCLCGKGKQKKFFTKWGIDYYRCAACGTIWADVSARNLTAFKSNNQLVKLRTSQEYQQNAIKKRDITWEELIDWLKFRTYRYLGTRYVKIIDYGNRYLGFVEKIKKSSLSQAYELRESILTIKTDNLSEADIILYMDNLQCTVNPLADIKSVIQNLRPGGLLFLGTRIGTGFDILALREHAKIFPYEHSFLPSVSVLEKLLINAGLDVLEIATPGRLDVPYVIANKDKIPEQEYFIKYLIENGNKTVFQELQRFLQKNHLSSYAQIVARRREA